MLRSEWSHAASSSANDSQSANSGFASSSNCNSTSKLDESGRSRSKVFNARFKKRKDPPPPSNEQPLAEPYAEDDADLNELNQVPVDYLNLQITAGLSVLPPETDDQFKAAGSSSAGAVSPATKSNLYIQKNALVCIARRLPLNNCEPSFPVEQFSSELDLTGQVLDLDTTGLSEPLKVCVQRMQGKNLKALVSSHQIDDMTAYLNSVIQSDLSAVVSDKFHLKLFDDELIVTMKSKKNNDCIIATHSIIKPIPFNEPQTINPTSSKFSFKPSPAAATTSSSSSSSSSNRQPIQVQQVQLKPNTKPTKRKNSATLSPQQTTPTTSYSSTFDFPGQPPHDSSPLNSTSLVSPFITSSISASSSVSNRNLGNLSAASNSSAAPLHKPTVSSEPTANPSLLLSDNSSAATNSIDMLNDCLSDLFPTSSFLDDYDHLATNSTDHTPHHIDFGEFSAQDDQPMSDQTDSSPLNQQADKLRNLLQQQDSSDQSDSSFSKQMSSLTTNLSKMDANQQPALTSSFDNTKNSSNSNSKTAGAKTKKSGKRSDGKSKEAATSSQASSSSSNQLLNEFLNAEDDPRLLARPSSSLSSSTNMLNLSNSNDLESLFSEKCNTIKTSQNYPASNQPPRSQNSSPNSKTAECSSKGNNMLRKLLNDEETNSNINSNTGTPASNTTTTSNNNTISNNNSSKTAGTFNNGRKNKDVLIQQLLRENSHPGSSPIATPSTSSAKLLSTGDPNSANSVSFGQLGDPPQSGKYGLLKRKSNEDHFSGSGSFLNTSNNSCNSQPGTPNQTNETAMETTYPSAKRLSLSESLSARPSSTPIPVTGAPAGRNQTAQPPQQVRYSTSSNSALGLNNNQQPMIMAQSPSSSSLPRNSPMNALHSPMNAMGSPASQQMSYTIAQPPTPHYQSQPVQKQNLVIINSNVQPNQMSGGGGNPRSGQMGGQLNGQQINPQQINPQQQQLINQQQQQQQQPQQSQQLAGQNPMLALMLARTPKTPPVSSISIPTSIVSQVPQERLPKNLEKKLIHTPTTINPQYSNQLGPFESEQQFQPQSSLMVTSQMSANPISSSSINHHPSLNHQHKQPATMFGGNPAAPPPQQQSQFFINNNLNTNLIASQQQQPPPPHQQMKPVLGLSGQFVQSNDQQPPPLSTTTTHLLNSSSSSTHQPVQPTSHSVQVSGNSSQQYLASNNKVATGILPPNAPSSNSVNEPKKSASSSSTLSNPNASSSSGSSSFVMNSAGNQMPIMNVQQGRNQPQLSTSSCSFYSERITSSSNLSESSSVAVSSTNGSVFFVLLLSFLEESSLFSSLFVTFDRCIDSASFGGSRRNVRNVSYFRPRTFLGFSIFSSNFFFGFSASTQCESVILLRNL